MPDSTAPPAGPHTDLPKPNCDGVWVEATTDGTVNGWLITMRNGSPFNEYDDPVTSQTGDRWTLYVPADSVSSPAVPADRPQPDREDGSYTKPAWSGWWIPPGESATAYLMTVANGEAHYGSGVETVLTGWRPAPIADAAEVERLKAELAKTESQRNRAIQIAEERNGEAFRLVDELTALKAERDAARAKVVRLESDNEIFVRDRDEARAALEAATQPRGYKPGSADAIAEDFEIFCVERKRYEIESLTDRIVAASSMAIRLREADSEF